MHDASRRRNAGKPRGRHTGFTPSQAHSARRYCTVSGTTTRTDTIDSLTSRQRAHLRSLAHHLKPILHVGTDGVTDPVVQSVGEAFNTRELLKVKLQDGAPVDVDAAARAIADTLDDVHVVQTIGRTMVLYRPDPDDPGIRLPG